jgi:DNA-directed RNA polymerase subunit F
MEIKSTRPASIAEAKDILEKRSKESELGYEQFQALEHGEKFAGEPEAIKKLISALTKHEKITEELAIKLIDISPSDPSTVKSILVKDRVELSEEEINQILKELS